jgi:hypothetical protein
MLNSPAERWVRDAQIIDNSLNGGYVQPQKANNQNSYQNPSSNTDHSGYHPKTNLPTVYQTYSLPSKNSEPKLPQGYADHAIHLLNNPLPEEPTGFGYSLPGSSYSRPSQQIHFMTDNPLISNHYIPHSVEQQQSHDLQSGYGSSSVSNGRGHQQSDAVSTSYGPPYPNQMVQQKGWHAEVHNEKYLGQLKRYQTGI